MVQDGRSCPGPPAQTVQVARLGSECWEAKTSNCAPASLAGDVQRIHPPSTVGFHPVPEGAAWRW
jgi:hypothetical protein